MSVEIIITGESGSERTAAVKTILAALSAAGVTGGIRETAQVIVLATPQSARVVIPSRYAAADPSEVA